MPFLKLSTLTIAVVSLCSVAANAQPVPNSLNRVTMIDHYLKYSENNENRAFAISEDGSSGASWNYGTVEEAKDSALNYCRQSAIAPCEVININGESVDGSDYTEAEIFREELEAAENQVWPMPNQEAAPIEIRGNKKLLATYAKYLKKTGHKALAVSPNGAWGSASKRTSDQQASTSALLNCEKHAVSCKIVDLNHKQKNGDAHPAPIKVSHYPAGIKTHKDLEKFEQYLNRIGAKAFALSDFAGSRRTTFVSGKESQSIADDQALSRCKKNTTKDCILAAQGNDIITPSQHVDDINTPVLTTLETTPELLKVVLQGDVDRFNKIEKGHRVMASDGIRTLNQVKGFLHLDIARDNAMKQCETFQEMRKKLPKSQKAYEGKNSKCTIIAENNTILVENVASLIAAQ